MTVVSGGRQDAFFPDGVPLRQEIYKVQPPSLFGNSLDKQTFSAKPEIMIFAEAGYKS